MTVARIALPLLSLAFTFAGCVAFPVWGVRALWPVLERSAPSVTNYRGSEIRYGLGAVALLWAAGASAAGAVQWLGANLLDAWDTSGRMGAFFETGSWPAGMAACIALVAAAFGFGLLDDLVGDRTERGFRGHLGALLRGRLTTGGLKLLGIGAVSAFAASTTVWGGIGGLAIGAERSPTWQLQLAGRWLLATLVIALAANVVNLTDLRPGRALKAYVPLAASGALLLAVAPLVAPDTVMSLPGASWAEVAVSAAAGLLFALGPVFAAWRLDLGESSMLGDAGANALGALAGYLLARSLGLPWIAIPAIVLLVANLASERVSFSRVIERNGMLRWLDGLGRAHPPEGGGTDA